MNEIDSRESFLNAIRPGAGEVGTWKYLIREHRFTLVRSFFEFFRVRPLFAVFVAFFIFNPSILGFLNVILSLGVSQFWNELMGQLEVLFNQFKVVRGGILTIIKNDPNLKLKRNKISQYLPAFAYHDISYFLVESFQKILPVVKNRPLTLDDQLEVFTINSERGIMVNVSSYPAPFRQSFIIFDHEPEDCGPFQRFTILHEVGHVVLGLAKSSYFAKHGFKTMLFSLGLAFLCFHIQTKAWIPILIFYLLGYFERLSLTYTADVRDEINCDIFALDYLAPEDIGALAKVSNLPALLRDTSLSPKHNRQRIQNLANCLKLKHLNPESFLDELLPNNKTMNYKPNFIRVLIMVLSLGATALFLSVKSWATLILFVLLVIMLILFFLSHIYSAANTKGLLDFLEQYEEQKITQ
jgi:hypothetical protein